MLVSLHACMPVCLHACMPVRLYVYTCICTCLCVAHTHTQTHTRAPTHTNESTKRPCLAFFQEVLRLVALGNYNRRTERHPATCSFQLP